MHAHSNRCKDVYIHPSNFHSCQKPTWGGYCAQTRNTLANAQIHRHIATSTKNDLHKRLQYIDTCGNTYMHTWKHTSLHEQKTLWEQAAGSLPNTSQVSLHNEFSKPDPSMVCACTLYWKSLCWTYWEWVSPVKQHHLFLYSFKGACSHVLIISHFVAGSCVHKGHATTSLVQGWHDKWSCQSKLWARLPPRKIVVTCHVNTQLGVYQLSH